MKRIILTLGIVLSGLSATTPLQGYVAAQSISTDDAIVSHLTHLGQNHLLGGLEQLSAEQKEQFWLQIKKYDATLLQHQNAVLFADAKEEPSLKPVQHVPHAGSQSNRDLGEKLIREGKVACLVLAGGQGSRLGIDGPKGVVAVSSIKGKSLFQLIAEKTRAASARAGRPLHLALMTSPLNDAQTREFFQNHNDFDLPGSHLHFFEQSVLPFCDEQGNWILERAGNMLEGPDGNGNALHVLYRSGLWQKWRAEGVEYVTVIPVDNPLADPFDAELIGYHFQTQAEVILKTIPRTSVDEKVGVIALNGDKINVVEYSELKSGEMTAVNPDGTPLFSVASISLFSFHMDFIQHIATDPQCSLPLHLAYKQASVIRPTAEGPAVQKIKGWKYEAFIFDLLPFANRVEILSYPRELVFSPLKNASGKESVETVRAALQAFDRYVYSSLSGLPAPETPFELDPAFYYPTPDLIQKWKGKELPAEPYIER